MDKTKCNNKTKVISALKKLDIPQKALNQLQDMDFTKHLVFSDGEERFKIDFMTYVSGVDFEEANSQKIITEIDELKLPFINIKHLIISKMGTGRPKDNIDVEELQTIEALKKNNK